MRPLTSVSSRWRRGCRLAGLLGATMLAAALAQAPASAASSAEEPSVDAALVLAVDVSFSMDTRERDLQRGGYVAALRSPEVMQAIRSGFLGRVMVTYVEWAGPGSQAVVVPWTLVDSPASAAAFADRIVPEDAIGRRGTSISSALSFAAGLFDEAGFRAQRRIVDVSGDGPNNAGEPVVPVRDALVRQGIVINGLPLVLERNRVDRFSIPNLDAYYRDCVIGGPAAFMIPVTAIEGFEEGVRRKLVQEIAGLDPPAAAIPIADAPADCLIGERLRGMGDWRR